MDSFYTILCEATTSSSTFHLLSLSFQSVLLCSAGVEQYSVNAEWRVNKDDGHHVENKGIIISSESSFRILVGNFKTGGDVYLPFSEKTLGIVYAFGSLSQYLN